ncbi:LuxR C-terminal-related transcriptional regulator [Rhizobium sp. A37_96]
MVKQLGRPDTETETVPSIHIGRGIWRARRLLSQLRIDEGLELIARIERALVHLRPGKADVFRKDVGLLRTMALAMQDSCHAAFATASALLGKNASHTDNAAAAALCRFAHWQLGHLGHVDASVWGGRNTALAGHRMPADILSLIVDAAIELQQLRLSAARRTAMEALGLAERLDRPEPALAALAASVAAQALYEEGLLEEAEELLLRRLETIKATGLLDSVWRTHFILSRIAAQREQYDFALLLLRQAETIGQKRGWSRLIAACFEERLNLLLRAGRAKEAELYAARLDRFAAGFEPRGSEPAITIRRHRDIAHVRLDLAAEQAAAALAELQRLHAEAIQRHDLLLALRLGLQKAAALEMLGRPAQAETLVLRALRLGAILGLFQIFIDEGTAVGGIVQRVYENALKPGGDAADILVYAGGLISHGDTVAPVPSKSKSKPKSYDCLSTREQDILRLVSQGLSNKRIAQSLKIAPETVKSHIKRIFSKLAVKTRAEAVARADALGLLIVSTQ